MPLNQRFLCVAGIRLVSYITLVSENTAAEDLCIAANRTSEAPKRKYVK